MISLQLWINEWFYQRSQIKFLLMSFQCRLFQKSVKKKNAFEDIVDVVNA